MIERSLSTAVTTLESEGEFRVAVEEVLPALTRLVGRYAPAGERDDVIQESLARAWVKRRQFDPKRGTPTSWLLAIAFDQSRKAYRSFRPRLPIGAPTRLRSVEDGLDVDFAVSRLAPRQRLAVECFYFADLSVSQTAVVMGCSEGTVKSTLADARARLRRVLEDPDGRG